MARIQFQKFKGLLLLFFLFSLFSCRQEETFVSRQEYLFGTYVEIRLFDGTEEDLEDVFKLLEAYDDIASKEENSQNGNGVYELNESRHLSDPSPYLLELLEFAENVKEETGGYVNILSGRLSDLWKEVINDDLALPSTELLEEEVAIIENSSFLFNDDGSLTLLGEAEVDLGSLAKGYAIMKGEELLKGRGVTSYLLNGGTSSLALGEYKDNFKVRIRNGNGYYLELKETSLGISSVYEQSILRDGIYYSHIVNPFTGSATPKHQLALVTGSSCALADAYSTYLLLLGEEVIETIEDNGYQVLLLNNGKITYQSLDLEVKRG